MFLQLAADEFDGRKPWKNLVGCPAYGFFPSKAPYRNQWISEFGGWSNPILPPPFSIDCFLHFTANLSEISISQRSHIFFCFSAHPENSICREAARLHNSFPLRSAIRKTRQRATHRWTTSVPRRLRLRGLAYEKVDGRKNGPTMSVTNGDSLMINGWLVDN